MNDNFKGFDFLYELCKKDKNFASIIKEGLKNETIRYFDDNEWDKIKSQNFQSPLKEMPEFYDMFVLGYNKGNCVGASRQLSFSYNGVDIVSGTLPILLGTMNAEKEGGHCWLETDNEIIDTSLLLVISKRLKKELGYKEEQRVTSLQLAQDERYQARKEFTNDTGLRKK